MIPVVPKAGLEPTKGSRLQIPHCDLRRSASRTIAVSMEAVERNARPSTGLFWLSGGREKKNEKVFCHRWELGASFFGF